MKTDITMQELAAGHLDNTALRERQTCWKRPLVEAAIAAESSSSSSAAWFRCRVQAGLVPLSSVVPPSASCLKMTLLLRSYNVTAQNDLKAGWHWMHDSGATLVFAKDSITVGIARARVAPFVVPKKDGRQRLIFDTREANHHFAPPPYTPLAGSQSLSSPQLPRGTALF